MIDRYFEKKLITNYHTKRNYRKGIENYFDTIKKDLKTYFKNKNDYEKDIGKYYLAIDQFPPMTKKNRVNAIKQFLSCYNREIKGLEIWDTISHRLRGAQSITEETSLDKNDLKKLLQYADLRGKTIFLVMSSSGCRIGEIVQLIPDDIHLNEDPARIVFRAEIVKGQKNKRTSFISNEAKESLKAWMKIRDKYLESAVKKSTFYEKKEIDDRVFPMTDVNVRLIWKNIVNKAGKPFNEVDKKTNRLKCHPHSLRKFFRSYLGNADLAEHLMGHTGYLSTYRQYNEKQLAIEYLKYINNVTVFESQPDFSGIHHELKEKDDLIKDMQKKIDELDWAVRKLSIQALTKDDEKKK